jgi:tripartite-type tricarboxylate transporter receptor subunit TctC
MKVWTKSISLLVLIMGVALIPWVPALAADYPAKPITFVVPFQPGGFTDLMSRALANSMKKDLGQPVIVENKGGGGGTVGIGYVTSRPADGYTIGLLTPGGVLAGHMGKSPYHPLKDLTYICRITAAYTGIVVKPDSPFKTLKDLVNYAKQNPGKVTYGTSGSGTITHLAMEDLGAIAGVNWKVLPFKSGPEAATALMGGHVDAVSDSPSWQPLVDGGKLRLLALFSEKRSPRYPDVPTVKESGFNSSMLGVSGIIGPKGMPKPVVQRLDSAFKKALDDPEVLEVLKRFDSPVLYLNSDDYYKWAQQDFETSGKLVKKLGLDKE